MSDIKFYTEPQVRLVGEPVVIHQGVEEFLDEHELDWPLFNIMPRNICPDGEFLPEMAGRGCYFSWDKQGAEVKKKTRNHEDYIKHIIEVGHGCMDEETDILTENGWKSWKDVKKEDKLCTLNQSTNTIEYQKPTRLIKYKHSGRMYKVDGKIDLLVTPDHKMYICKTTTKEGRKRNNFELMAAERIDDLSHAYSKIGDWNNGTNGDVSFFKLLGFTIGDGSIDLSSNQIKFHLKKTRKIEYLKRLCKSLNLKLSTNNNKYVVDISSGQMSLFKKIYNKDKEKQIPQHLLIDLNKRCLQALYHGLIFSDGHISKTGTSFFSTSQILINQFQQLCLHIGLCANIGKTYSQEERKSFGKKPLTVINVITRNIKPEVNKYKDSKSRSSWINNWSGNVYCAEVPNHIMYVRRNGKPVWTGNSVLEHTNLNFMIWGISRSLSHELVRHRQGVAISQLSQRYVGEDQIQFCIPPEIEKIRLSKPALFAKWVSHMLDSKALYGELVEGLDDTYDKDVSKLERRKRSRQSARSVLPNATQTSIFWTANIRTLRHVIEMRANPAADLEIRSLAVKLFEILRDTYPVFIHGMTLVDMPDGSKCVESKFRKV